MAFLYQRDFSVWLRDSFHNPMALWPMTGKIKLKLNLKTGCYIKLEKYDWA